MIRDAIEDGRESFVRIRLYPITRRLSSIGQGNSSVRTHETCVDQSSVDRTVGLQPAPEPVQRPCPRTRQSFLVETVRMDVRPQVPQLGDVPQQLAGVALGDDMMKRRLSAERVESQARILRDPDVPSRETREFREVRSARPQRVGLLSLQPQYQTASGLERCGRQEAVVPGVDKQFAPDVGLQNVSHVGLGLVPSHRPIVSKRQSTGRQEPCRDGHDRGARHPQRTELRHEVGSRRCRPMNAQRQPIDLHGEFRGCHRTHDAGD